MQNSGEIIVVYSTTTSDWTDHCGNYFWSFDSRYEIHNEDILFLISFFLSQGHAQSWSNAIWPPSSLPTFALIANLGLIFFMFFLGLELDLDQIKKSWKTTIPIACTSILIPGK